jgi:hypothetical protein
LPLGWSEHKAALGEDGDQAKKAPKARGNLRGRGRMRNPGERFASW